LDSVAENTLTGTVTRPKTIVPFQIERGAMAVWLPTQSRKNAISSTGARSGTRCS
jgi:hypothetical protein